MKYLIATALAGVLIAGCANAQSANEGRQFKNGLAKGIATESNFTGYLVSKEYAKRRQDVNAPIDFGTVKDGPQSEGHGVAEPIHQGALRNGD
jgi:hypothetical protein